MASAFGFIGVGIMGEGMVKNLLKAGRPVVVWNRGAAKCEALKAEFGALVTIAASPAEVVGSCATTYSMLSTLEASEAVFPAVLAAVAPGKAIIDCATLTPERMAAMASAVAAAGGAFLEAPVSGSKGPAAAGQLIFLCAGDQPTFDAAAPELDLMGKAKFYLGAVGAGTRMKLVVNMTMGSMLASLAEGAALAQAADLDQAQLLEVLDLGVMSNMMFRLKGPSMVARDHSNTQFPLKHAQKDMRFALALGDALAQPLPLAAAANERMIGARALGHDDSDFSAVYETCRPTK